MAYTFKLDPVLLLEEPTALRRAVRAAAHNIIVDETNKNQK